MNEDILKGKWKQLKGTVQAKWGHITDDEFDIIEGNSEKLVGCVQENAGIAREEAEKEVKEWMDSLKS